MAEWRISDRVKLGSVANVADEGRMTDRVKLGARL
jgi:hypothetical protein